MKLLKRLFFAIVILILLSPVIIFFALKVIDLNQFKPQIVDAVKEQTGRELVINGKIDSAFGITPSLKLSDVTLSNADWATQDHMLKIGSANVSVDLSALLQKEIKVSDISLSDTKVVLEISKKGPKNWEFTPAVTEEEPVAEGEPTAADEAVANVKEKVAAEAASIETTFNTITLKNIDVRFLDHSAGKDISLNVAETKLDVNGAPAIDLTVKSGDATIDLSVKAKSFAALQAGTASISVNARGAAGENITFNGGINDFINTNSFSGSITAKGNTLKSFNKLAGSELPSIPAYNVSTKVSGTPDKISLKSLDATLDGTNIKGNADITLSGSKPYIKAELSIPSVGSSGGSSSGESGDGGSPSSGRVIPNMDLPVDSLTSLNGDISIKIGSIGDGGSKISNLSSAISIKNGKMRVKPFSFGMAGSTFNGSLTVNAANKTPSFAFDIGANNIVLGNMLKSFGQNDLSGGKTNFKTSVTGYGKTLHGVIGTLKGSLVAFIDKASYNSNASILKSANLVNTLSGANIGSSVPINCVATKIAISGGIMRPSYMAVDAAGTRVDGEGSINLGSEKLALTFYPKAKVAGLEQLTIPMKMGGTFSNPKVYADPKGAVTNIANVALKLSGKSSLAYAGGSVIASDLGVSADNPCFKAREKDADLDIKEALKDVEGKVKAKAKAVEKKVRDARDTAKKSAKDIKKSVKNLKNIKDSLKSGEGIGDAAKDLGDIGKNLDQIKDLKNLKLF